MNTQPRIFIGSTNESIEVARQLETELKPYAIPVPWECSFRPGYYTLAELEKKADEVDYAVFVVGAEDWTDSRDAATAAPRDNIVYEAGLFAGRLGIPNVFLLVAHGTKIPSDLKGLNYLEYDPLEDLERIVRDQGIKMGKQLSKWKMSLAQQIGGKWWDFVASDADGSIIGLKDLMFDRNTCHWKFTGESWTVNGKSKAQFHTMSASLDVLQKKLHYSWEGEHPLAEGMPLYFGVGEIQFEVHGTQITTARGRFSSSKREYPHDTRLLSTRYRRVSAEELKIIAGHDDAAMRRLIGDLLIERDRVNGMSSSLV